VLEVPGCVGLKGAKRAERPDAGRGGLLGLPSTSPVRRAALGARGPLALALVGDGRVRGILAHRLDSSETGALRLVRLARCDHLAVRRQPVEAELARRSLVDYELRWH